MGKARELPILFNDEMVRATLDGRKTQTRRPINPQPPEWANHVHWGCVGGKGFGFWFTDSMFGDLRARERRTDLIRSPFGIPGDTLYVREAWRPMIRFGGSRDAPGFINYRADDGEKPDARASSQPSSSTPLLLVLTTR